ncbi:MAG: FHA domain-containing protein [Planctomycetaceae bacterium]|nr:FHA domain-containing protein [Planctomycetaceae bacterium]
MLTIVLKEAAGPVTFNLSDDVITIGRSKENNIVLKNIKSSRRHARIERIGATYQITDLGSGNGTKVNGKKIDFQTLKKGDEIKIGDALLTLRSIDDSVEDDADATDAGESDEIKIAGEEELKIADDSDDNKLEIVGEEVSDKDTEKIAWSEAETEVQAPAVKAKPAVKAPPARPSLNKPAAGKPGAAPAPKPLMKKPLGRQAPK